MYISDCTNLYKESVVTFCMTPQPAEYHHDLGNGMSLSAYAVDPDLDGNALKEIVESQRGDSRPVIQSLEGDISVVGHFNSLRDLRVETSDKPYQVPEQLRAYRDALGIKLDAEGKFSGPIAPVVGPTKIPLKLCRGGYYDFIATQLEQVPADLLPELVGGRVKDLFIDRFKHARGEEERFLTRYSPELIERFQDGTLERFAENRGCGEGEIRLLRDRKIEELLNAHDRLVSGVFDIEIKQIKALEKARYPAGRTIEELMPEWGMENKDRARYIGFAFLMATRNGEEMSLVQRAKGMGVAPDCMSSPGSTPGFPDSDSARFYEDHIAEEMNEEYDLRKGDFDINKISLLDFWRDMPFGAVEIVTPFSTKELAQKIYGKQKAIEEHPVLYGLKPEAIGALLDNFDVFPGVALTLNLLCGR